MLLSYHFFVDLLFPDTSFVASRGGWMYCDDSRVTPVDANQVVVSQLNVNEREPFFELIGSVYRESQLTFYSIREPELKLSGHILLHFFLFD
jgi:hypothetical protein